MQIDIPRIVSALRDAGLLVTVGGNLPKFVSGVADDSRLIQKDYLFVAVRGRDQDGHTYLSVAFEKGAVAAIVEESSGSFPCIVVNNSRKAAAVAAAVAYDYPAKGLKIIGVTGTNGKTTTTFICRHLLENSASIGTIGVLLGSEGVPMEGGQGLTTPGPVELQRILRALIDRGVTSVAMEVSSHSLDQGRVDGLEFDVAVFTNLTHDHLDYHGDMDSYFKAKAKLLNYLKPEGTVVINADDKIWKRLDIKTKQLSFGLRHADVYARMIHYGPTGSDWALYIGKESAHVRLPMIGGVNVYNALGAAAAAHVLGLPVRDIAARLSTLPQVPGRLEVLADDPVVIRDYAHTPDALRRLLQAVRPLTKGWIVVVFGCGGDRDRTKRPVMGAIAEEYGDVVIITNDNPRTEDPEKILDDVELGMKLNKHFRIADRREAIAKALDVAQDGEREDIVLLAGKGHETYQIRGTTKYPFDEKQIVRDLLEIR